MSRRRGSITRIATRWNIDERAAAELALNFERAQGGGGTRRRHSTHRDDIRALATYYY